MFTYLQHPHVKARKAVGPIKTADQVKGNLFNRWLAKKVTAGVGTMWCAYAFAGLSLVSLPSVLATHNVVAIVSWIAQTFLQLVLLSVILVSQNLDAAASDLRADQTYQDAEAILHGQEQMQAHMNLQDETLSEIKAKVMS